MKKSVLFTLGLLTSVNTFAGEGTQWSYSGATGAENWASLSRDFSSCNGKNQSPVNLTGFIEAQLSPLSFNYQSTPSQILNNGHTVQLNFKSGSSVTIEGTEFHLLQVHFHAPSENHIKGKSYPLEAHFVHRSNKGKYAVLAVMFEAGQEHMGLAEAWQTMPKKAGQKLAFNADLKPLQLFPENRDYYRFNGSLTTPPCTEGLRWFVMKESVQASEAQIKQFASILNEPNNRPLQPLNARLVLQ